MKLILSSDGSFLLKYGYGLTGIPKDQMFIGYVTTAYQVSRNNFQFFENYKNSVKDAGYRFEEMDIKGKNEKEIREFFKDKNVIHIEGGNTFYLLKIMKETGFDKIVKELINNSTVYIGTSAGAYVACPTIEVSDWNQDGKDRFGLTDFSSMSFIPFLLKVHYKDEQKDFIKEHLKNCKYPLRILRDGQGILVEDDKYKFLGDGEEVVIE